MLITDFLRNSAEQYPDNTAIVYQDKRLTYSQLDSQSDVLSGSLIERGIKKGDRVAIFLDNCCEYVVSYFGILKAGACVVALNSQLVSRELFILLDDCLPTAIITDYKHASIAKDALGKFQHPIVLLIVDKEFLMNTDKNNHFMVIACASDDLAQIIYTSGTTGKPKGVMLSHGNLSANADSIIEYLHLTSEDKIMVVLPFYYSYGTSLLTTHIKTGGTLVIDNRFIYPNVVLDTMVKEKVTGFAGVPSHYAILLKKSAFRKYQFPHLKYVTQAGGAMAPAMIKEFLTILPNVKFYIMYGQTEASARLSYLDPKNLEDKMGSIGKAIPNVELKVLNEQGKRVMPGEIGEIVARGENIMKGYWNDPVQTSGVLRKQGLFTGDLARIDEDGFIYIVSRKKYMIKSGANRISPLEIEDTICMLSGVLECAAVGIPDEILGETIKVFVVTSNSAVTDKEIMIFCKNNLASYKIPKEIEIVSELPRTASGKIHRESIKRCTAYGI